MKMTYTTKMLENLVREVKMGWGIDTYNTVEMMQDFGHLPSGKVVWGDEGSFQIVE